MDSLPKKVTELYLFPFDSYEELVSNVKDKKVRLRAIGFKATPFFYVNNYVSVSIKRFATFFSLLPLIIIIFIVLISLLTKSWLLLIAIPCIIIQIKVFTPDYLRMIPRINVVILALIVVLLRIIGLIYEIEWLSWTMRAIITTEIAKHTYWALITTCTIETALIDEELFCRLWLNNVLTLVMPDGRYLNNVTQILKGINEIDYPA